MLWGIAVVIKHLRKGRKALNVIKAMRFTPISKNHVLIERVREIATRTVWKDLCDGVYGMSVNQEISITPKGDSLKLDCRLRDDGQDLPRPVGFKEKIQLVSRSFVLKRIHYNSEDGLEAFYAKTIDARIVRHFRNRKEKRSESGWIFCVLGKTQYPGRLIVHPRFTGSAKILVNLAYKVANITPVHVKGLLPEFEELFEVESGFVDEKVPFLDERSQLQILQWQNAFTQDTKLTLDREGVWLSGSSWPEPDKFKALVSLCYSLFDKNF